ncbi:retrovirus-related pol polyprotein from transposon TNT 1-94 [Tanacetum coccineum]
MISEAFSLEEEKSWWVDSRATRHVCNDHTMFKTYEPSYSMIYMGNHTTAQVKGQDKIDLVFTSGNTLTLNDVLHVPDVRKNFMSGSLLNKFSFKLVVESNKFILSKGGKFIGKGYHTSGMFKLNIKDVVNSSVNDVNMTEISDANDASAGIVTNNDAINKMPTSSYYFDSSLLWHARLGHIYFKSMRNMANANLIPKLDSKNDKCQTCMHTKITRLPFPTIQRSSKILELVHSGVSDLHATPTICGKKYFANFIDDYSRYCYVYLLHSKDEVLEKFRIYKSEIELKCDTRIKCLRTHRGGEYYDPTYFQSTGIVHQVTAPYTPQQNGIAERKNHTLMDMVNSMMAIVRLPESKKRKLGDKGIKCIFLGYAQNSKAYRFIVVEPNDLILVNTIIESRDARFDENRFKTILKAHEISNETVSTEIPITTEGSNDDSFLDHQQVKPRRSTRQRRQRTFGPDFNMYLVEGDRKEVVNDEMDSIIGNNTWILVDLTLGSKAIKSKWIFKRKLRVDGNIEKFKAWLVAKGFTQREGLDYIDTYAPVVRTTTIRILIALGFINKLIIYQMDVKTAFLNGELDEEVYMEQPEDAMLIFGTDIEQVQMIKKLLSKNFEMKDLGEADVILGIKILRKENRPMLTQSHYIKKILNHFDSFDFFPVSTPFEVGSKLTYNTRRILAQNKYSKVISSLMYAMTCTRPDIAYAVGRLSRHTSSPGKEHWDAINRVFKYLKTTMDYGLVNSGDPSVLEGYTDASWITDQEDYASTRGWLFTLGGGAVS